MVLFGESPKRPQESKISGRRGSVLWKRRSQAPDEMKANSDAQKQWEKVRPVSPESSRLPSPEPSPKEPVAVPESENIHETPRESSQTSRPPTSKGPQLPQRNNLSVIDSADSKALSLTCRAVDLDWYPFWLQRHLDNLPMSLRELRIGADLLAENINSLEQIFTAVRAYVRLNAGADIDEILYYLQAEDIIDNEPKLLDAQRLLVFSVLGWLSMLYIPSFNVCSLSELAIQIPVNTNTIVNEWKIPVEECERPLYAMLRRFGSLLPARSVDNASWNPIYPDTFNAHRLNSLLNINIRWVDTVSLHLDWNRSTRTLSLFSCPSFCLAMLESKCSGAMYSFASNSRGPHEPRANRDDVTQYLQEILLSYRLLFAQYPAARHYFRKVFKPTEELEYRVDSLLPILCTQKRVPGVPKDRDIYYAGRDFPVLHKKIEALMRDLEAWTPNRTDSPTPHVTERTKKSVQWTSWPIAVFIGIVLLALLNLASVVLAVMQLYTSHT